MHSFMQYTTDNAPEASRPVLQQLKKAMGFVPNLYATFAESPAALEGFVTLEASLAKGTLSRVERELVRIAVSTENGCAYCVAAHSTLAGMLKARPEVVAAIRAGVPVPDPKIETLVAFTRALVRHKGFVPEQTVEGFLNAGYTKAQVVEVVGHVGLKTFHNYVHALSQAPLDAAFQSEQWDRGMLQVA